MRRLLSVFVLPVTGLIMQAGLATLDSVTADGPRVVMAAQSAPVMVPTTTTTTPLSPATTAPTPPKRASRGTERVTAFPRSVPGSLTGVGQVNGYPCGGDLPPCRVLRRESGGNPRAYNARGCGGKGCGGLWQFDPRTWVNCWCRGWESMTFRGYARAQLAPAGVQNERAIQLWNQGHGCGHWDAC